MSTEPDHAQFGIAAPFSDGLAAVKIGDFNTGKAGLIDKTGRIVINPQLDDVGFFSEGLAQVRIGDKWGFIAR